ncbi:ATP-binding cassette domain-containing protein [Tersicoccus sp. MR15.9]|uniref:ATP-binding cassette domain-containing protein n=1 Tax=Tersicoccus mangrovi TaxID=3121635 RepID=UPI002FE54E92
MTENAVEASGLIKRFGANTAVDGIDLTVEQGQVFGVLGPNGAGKTTTIRMLATLLPIDGGRASILGHDVARDPHAVRGLIGLTGQYASVDEELTARENLTIFGRLLGLSGRAATARANTLLEQFALTEAATRPLRQFSGGMRRRLDLAASLIAQPPLIFLDEPTTGLDPRTRGQMWDTIRELVRGGSTILLTTQYLDEADQLADRIAVIDQGRKVAEGTPDDLKSSVGSASLSLRLTDAARLAAAAVLVERQLGVAPALTPEASRLVAPLASTGRTVDVLTGLRDAGIDVAEVAVHKPSLDEVFLALTADPTADRRPAPAAGDQHAPEMEPAR